jgi:CopG antitoxin of type II toxin-antitoxin system
MAKNKAKRLPRLKSVDELVEFFDKHDMGDYWDRLPKAKFEVKIKTRKHLVAIDEQIIPSINQIAKSKRVTSAKLINTWLREKIATSKQAWSPGPSARRLGYRVRLRSLGWGFGEPRSQSDPGKDRDWIEDPKAVSGPHQAKYLSQDLTLGARLLPLPCQFHHRF